LEDNDHAEGLILIFGKLLNLWIPAKAGIHNRHILQWIPALRFASAGMTNLVLYYLPKF